MPTYDYVCTACGHEFELVQRITAPPRKRCPKCGKKVERRIGAGAGLLFKGSGFYITDYRSSEYHAKAKAEKGETGKTASKEGGTHGNEAGRPAGGGDAAGAEGPKPAPGPSKKEGGAKEGGRDSGGGGSGTKKASK